MYRVQEASERGATAEELSKLGLTRFARLVKNPKLTEVTKEENEVDWSEVSNVDGDETQGDDGMEADDEEEEPIAEHNAIFSLTDAINTFHEPRTPRRVQWGKYVMFTFTFAIFC